jgi:phosphomannomutase
MVEFNLYTMNTLSCFKAYDIRGKLGEELNEDIAWRIGRAYGEYLKPQTIVLGGDVRLTSESLKLALAKGLQDAGVDVLDIGLSGTEEIYFATFHLGVDGGIEVTASHNPMDYNGMKLVRKGARPISGDTGLRDVQRLAEANDFPPVNDAKRGSYKNQPAKRVHRPPAGLHQRGEPQAAEAGDQLRQRRGRPGGRCAGSPL